MATQDETHLVLVLKKMLLGKSRLCLGGCCFLPRPLCRCSRVLRAGSSFFPQADGVQSVAVFCSLSDGARCSDRLLHPACSRTARHQLLLSAKNNPTQSPRTRHTRIRGDEQRKTAGSSLARDRCVVVLLVGSSAFPRHRCADSELAPLLVEAKNSGTESSRSALN